MANRVGESLEFEGYVDDFNHNVSAIQFSLDGGATWTEYSTIGAVKERGLTWRFVYCPQSCGLYLLKVRAVDGKGVASDIIAEYAFEVEP